MDKFLKSALLFLLLGYWPGASACRTDPPPPRHIAEQPRPTNTKPAAEIPTSVPVPIFVQEGLLEFRGADGAKTLLRLDIEIAHEGAERAQGLMWRKKMEDKQGMLFIFDYPEPQSFWMRNTYIPLDMIFVNEKFEVVTVLKNVPVLNDAPRPSGKPAQYVIEVNAGLADRYGIVPGVKVAWSDFVTGLPGGDFPVDAFLK